MARRLPIEGTVIGAEQILGERQPGRDAFEFPPEAPADALVVSRQPIGRLKPNRVFRSHGASAPSQSALSWGSRAVPASSCAPASRYPLPSWAAIAFMALASAMSRWVTPPA